MRTVVLGLVLALAGLRPVQAADEPLVPPALSDAFHASPGGFFLCTSTPTSPADTPDCFLGYVVPGGQSGQGRLRAVGSGFQRSSNFTVLEEIWVEPGAFTIGSGTATVDATFPDLGRLQVSLTGGVGGPGWANSGCPRTVLAYGLAGGGSTVFPVTAVQGTLSRHRASEDVALYGPPHPLGCFAFFTGPASGVWRMSHPHSAGRRRFELPPPLPSGPGAVSERS